MTNDSIPGECRYFVTYSGVKLPFTLTAPLTEQEIANRNTFFRGYFDAEGRLNGFEKLAYGETELLHRYQYHADGTLQRAEITDIDGETTVLEFDTAGKPLPVS